MYVRDKARTERMIDRYFKMYYRAMPSDSHPFNGVVKLSNNFPYNLHYYFTPNKKYYIINGYILDDEGYAYGVYKGLEKYLNEGMCMDFPAYPIETLEGLENNLFIEIKD